MKWTGLFLSIFLMSGLSLQAQEVEQGQAEGNAPVQEAPPVREDFSDETLEKFVDINLKLVPHQEEGEKQMLKAIEEEGLEAERFGEIMRAQQLNDSTNAGASADEVKKAEAAANKIMGIQQDLQQKITTLIQSEGMELKEFQEIVWAYQQSPKVQKKVNDMLDKSAAPGAGDSTVAPEGGQ